MLGNYLVEMKNLRGIALGINVFADMHDSYQRGVSTEGIILGGALTAATVVGFVVGGVVCIVTDLFLAEWLGIDEWIDSVAK